MISSSPGTCRCSRPSYTAPRKNMTHRPRQTMKAATVKSRMRPAGTTPLCPWSIRENGQKPCWIWACNVPVRQHQASALWACGGLLWQRQTSGARRESEPAVSRLGSSSLNGKTQESALSAPEYLIKSDGTNPLVASLDIWVGNVPFWKHQSTALWTYSIPLREHQAS